VLSFASGSNGRATDALWQPALAAHHTGMGWKEMELAL
jgi:hypothetical protein